MYSIYLNLMHDCVCVWLMSNSGKGETPLMTACAYGRVDIATFLLRLGANVNVVRPKTVFFHANFITTSILFFGSSHSLSSRDVLRCTLLLVTGIPTCFLCFLVSLPPVITQTLLLLFQTPLVLTAPKHSMDSMSLK